MQVRLEKGSAALALPRSPARWASSTSWNNAVIQIPSVFSVLRFTFTEKLWIPVTTIMLLATAAGAGYGICKVEHHLEFTAPKHSPPDYR